MAPPLGMVWKQHIMLLAAFFVLYFLMQLFMHRYISKSLSMQQPSRKSDFVHRHRHIPVHDISDVSTPQGQIAPPQENDGLMDCLPGYYSAAELQPQLRRPPQDPFFPGGAGKAYRVSDLTAEEEMERNMGYAKYNFNAFVSDRISPHRDLGPDTRPPECLAKKFKRCPGLSPVSVIIIFYNEARSTLLRTVHSVLYTVPHFLLHEIILVDDGSTNGECWPGWLEPLLERIALNNTLVVSPDVAFINRHTFQFERPVPKPSSHTRGTFDWSLAFMFEPLPQALEDVRTDKTQPFPTPVIPGGLFAISKSFFQHIGSYDPDMQIWGGENLEMSLRVWMCGGKLEIVPCSVVGHVYHKENPHSFPEGSSVMSRNLVRLAEVWMDEYKVLFYRRHMEAARIFKEKSYGDLSQRHLLREQLGCKSFGWYMNTVRSDFFIPELNPRFYGALVNVGLKKCLNVGELEDGKARAGTSKCHGDPALQYFEYSSLNELRHNVKNELCLSVAHPSVERPVFTFQACVAQDGERNVPPHQVFFYEKGGLLRSQKFNLCLQAERYTLFMAYCNSEEYKQVWIFIPVLPN